MNLRHPCVIDIHDAFQVANPKTVYIVMAYCECGDLSDVIRATKGNNKTLSESQVRLHGCCKGVGCGRLLVVFARL